MSGNDEPPNPYAAPASGSSPPSSVTGREPPARVRTIVTMPAVMLICVGALGASAGIVGCAQALFSSPPPIDPDLPEFVNDFNQGAVGPVAAVIQGVFTLVNVFTIVGAVFMLRFKYWPLALATSIVSILNCGNCCCVLGAPIGTWALVVLNLADVKSAFRSEA